MTIFEKKPTCAENSEQKTLLVCSEEQVSSGFNTHVPWWAVSALFFCTSYNGIFKRYVTMVWSNNGADDLLARTAVVSLVINMVIIMGTVLFSWVADRWKQYYVSMTSVLGTSAILSIVAWMLACWWPLFDWRIEGFMILIVFISSGPHPLRDAIVTKLVEWDRQNLGGAHQTFGKQRLFLVVGQLVLVIVTSGLMSLFGPSSCLAVLAGCFTAASVVFGVNFKSVTDHYEKVLSMETADAAAPARPKERGHAVLEFLLLGVPFTLIGIASGLIDYIFFSHLRQLGTPLSALGTAHVIALATEIPMFYFADRFVEFIGSLEVVFAISCVITCIRLTLLAGFVVDRTPTAFTIMLVILTESVHGFASAPVRCVTARLASEMAPPNLRATLQGYFNLAVGHGGAAVSCVLLFFCHKLGARANFAAAAMCSLLAIPPIMARRFVIHARYRHACKVKRLVIVVRADPVLCGHATEARNLAEAARKCGCEVHIVTWPLSVLEKAKLPMKPEEEPYSPGIYVHRPDPIGDEKVLDGMLLQGMASRIIEILMNGGGEVAAGVKEVDLILSMYVIPHCQVVSLAAEALRRSGMYKKKLVTIAKAVGSDITTHLAACVRGSMHGGAMVMLSQYLNNNIIYAVSQCAKETILEYSKSIDEACQTTFTAQLSAAIGISYPPLDTVAYSAFCGSADAARANAQEILSKYNVKYGEFILFMSRIILAKGLGDLINAYVSSNVRKAGIPMLIAGAGPDMQQIQEMAKQCDKISVVAPILGEEKILLLHACSVFCLPSKPVPSFVETFGVAIAEKMAAGGPGVVLTTRTGGIPEASGGPSCCIEVECSVESIRAGLERASFMPPSERSAMAYRAQAFVKRFDSEFIWGEIGSAACKLVSEQAE